MKKLLLVVVLLQIIMYGCEKEEIVADTPKTFADKIELQEIKVFDDSVQLSWSVLDTTAFKEYWIIRTEGNNYEPYDGYYYAGHPDLVHRITDQYATTFTDKNLPYTPDLKYFIVGKISTEMHYEDAEIISNPQSFNRPEIKVVDIIPYDIIHNSEDHLLYLLEEESGKIALYNYKTQELVNTVHTNATIGFSDMGIYNSRKELYVARNDGWIFVYDPLSLTKTGQIDVGQPLSSVVANNGLLFVSTNDYSWNNGSIRVFDRRSGSLIASGGHNRSTRFKVIPGTNTELIDITLYVGPVDLSYYSFDEQENSLNGFADRYHGDYPLDAHIFEIMPDNNHFITSSEGAVYTKDLIYKTRLPRGNLQFTSFAFDPVKNLIYCGTESRTIEVYKLSDYSHVKSIPAKGYPVRIFLNQGELISVSKTTDGDNATKVVVEKLAP